MSIIIKKILSITFYCLAIISLVILIKTEIRKWIFFGGEPSSANTLVFWVSLVATILFGLCGSTLWKKSRKNNKELEKREKEEDDRMAREAIENFKKSVQNKEGR